MVIDRRLRRAGGQSLQRQIAEVFRVCEQAIEAELAKNDPQASRPQQAVRSAAAAVTTAPASAVSAAGAAGAIRTASPSSSRAAAAAPTRPGSASVARDLPGLAGPQPVPPPRSPSATGEPPTIAAPPAQGITLTTGARVATPPRPATIPQIKALQAIASQAGVALGAETSRRFGVPAAKYLTVQQASRLIDDLKALLSAAAS
jgi:hypothetical protein